MRSIAWGRKISAARHILAFLLWLALWSSTILSAETLRQAPSPATPVQEAFKAGEIDAWAESIGIGFRQPMVRLHLFNRVQGEITIYVPMGTVLSAPSNALADLVIADALTVTVPSYVGVEINAFSLAYDRGFPSATGAYSYTVGSIADSQLVTHLATSVTQPSKQEFGAQLAVWSWSLGLSLEDLTRKLPVPPMPEDIELANRLLGGSQVSPEPPTQVFSSGTVDEVTPGQPVELTPVPPLVEPWRPGCPGLLLLGFLVVGLLAASAWVAGRKRVPDTASLWKPKQETPASLSQETAASVVDITHDKRDSGVAGSPVTVVRPVSQFDAPSLPGGDVDPDATHIPTATELVAIVGPLAGRRWQLTGQCIISRGEVNWLVIPDSAISVPHVALDMAEPALRVKDLASKNGVTLSGKRLESGFFPVADGQEIGIGSLLLMLNKKQLQVTKGSLKGKSYGLGPGMTVISREKLLVIVTGAQDGTISDVHALLSLEGQGVSVKDLNSGNGTFIDRNLVQDQGMLGPGAHLRLGSSEFIVQIRFGSYTLLSLLGEGGMARVYLAESERHVKWALKIPHDSHSDFKQRFMRELNNHSHLVHTNIVGVHETGEVSGRPFVAMQYIDGGTLQARLMDGKPLQLDVALRIAREVADALTYAYSQGVMFHRDIKPSNILLDQQGKAYLTDFGIAKAKEDLDITNTSDVLGTVYYMSPEQAQGSKDLDKRTDVYSLGVVLYQMLAGVVPFDTTSSKPAILHKHVYDPPPPLREANPAVPQQVEQIVLKCLEKKPEDRYQSAQALSEALKAAGGG